MELKIRVLSLEEDAGGTVVFGVCVVVAGVGAGVPVVVVVVGEVSVDVCVVDSTGAGTEAEFEEKVMELIMFVIVREEAKIAPPDC